MAWNEPGGGRKDQDPWRAKQDKGPPDLDEVVKKLQDKFGGLFGSGKGNGNGANGKGGLALVGVIIVLVVMIWGVAGFYRVEQAQQALVLRFGKFHDVVGAGLHWNPRLVDRVYKVDVTKVNQHSSRATMLTEDQNIVDITLDVQYRVDDPRAYFLQIANAEAALRHSTESALRHVVGGAEMGNVITEGREAIAVDVHARLQEYLARYSTGLSVTKVNIEDAHPPKEVKAAFDDVIKAKEDEERLQSEAQAYANGIIPESRGKAQRVLEEANAYQAEVVAKAEGEASRFQQLLIEYAKAPEVTRQRLYIDTMQDVLSRTTKVMVDVKGGNNLLYLPFDKLMSLSGSTVAPEPVRISVQSDDGTGSPARGTERLRQNRRWGENR